MRADYIWMNGKLVAWDQAQVHALVHGLHYGSSVFEGLRAYEIAEGSAILCGPEHFQRLLFSCKAMRMPSPLSILEWMTATITTLKANKQRGAYIRPLVYRGLGESFGLDGRDAPVETLLAAVSWGAYLGEKALEEGVDVEVSSWRRSGPGSASPLAKIGGQYVTSQSIVMEAHDHGVNEGIALDAHGNVSEGSGENVFLVYKGEIVTPGVSSSILCGITRNCVIAIARDLGYRVIEAAIPREMLHLADEAFFSGTAAEICPIRSVDRIAVGDGTRGPITRAIQETFFEIVHGTRPDKFGWLTKVA